MKHIVLKSLAIVALTGSRMPAQSFIRASVPVTPLRLSVRPDSRLWLEGSSNVRDWRCDATTLDAAIDVDGGVLHAGPTYGPAVLSVRSPAGPTASR